MQYCRYAYWRIFWNPGCGSWSDCSRYNPHIIKRVLAERIFGMHCRPTFMKEGHTTFELMGETFCQEQDCNALRSGLSPCKLHRYGGTHYPQSLYHLDGKNFQKYRSMQTGIIFGNCSGRTQDFLDGTVTISDYINHLDQRIATASNSKLCDPREDCPSCLWAGVLEPLFLPPHINAVELLPPAWRDRAEAGEPLCRVTCCTPAQPSL